MDDVVFDENDYEYQQSRYSDFPEDDNSDAGCICGDPDCDGECEDIDEDDLDIIDEEDA